MKTYEVVLCFRFNWLPFLVGVAIGYAARWIWVTHMARSVWERW